MLEHTKKHHTKKDANNYPRLFFNFHDKSFLLKNVSEEDIQPIKDAIEKVVNNLPIEKREVDEGYVSVDEAFSDLLEDIGGEPAYRKAALVIKSSRLQADMSQKALAELLQTEQSYISKMERAKIPVGKKLAQKLGEVFGKTYKMFMTD